MSRPHRSGSSSAPRRSNGWPASGKGAGRQRPPSAQELSGLVEDHVIEEILYREALALGLDRDDTVIRRRLRQKMEFLAQDPIDAAEPTEAELGAFLAENPERFQAPARVSFRQIFINADRRGSAAAEEARRLLAELTALPRPAEAEILGDPFLLPHYFDQVTEQEVERQFGKAFAKVLGTVASGRWVGPIDSAYGLHLVFVHDRRAGEALDLAQARRAVEREWRARRRVEAKDAFYERLRRRHRVEIDWPEGTGPSR
jgi:hypothetical protein